MYRFFLALVCASLSGCMVQDTAHSGVSDAAEHADSSRVNRCLDKCSQLRDCFSANHGGDVMAMCCGRSATTRLCRSSNVATEATRHTPMRSTPIPAYTKARSSTLSLVP